MSLKPNLLKIFKPSTGLTSRLCVGSQVVTNNLNPFAPQTIRSFSHSHISLSAAPTRFIQEDYGIFDDFIPIPKEEKPSVFSPIGRKLALRNLRHSVGNIYGIGLIKWNIKGWKPATFLGEAEEIYKTMNTAYAAGDLKTLQNLALAPLYQKMKSEIKARKSKFVWSYEGQVEPSRLISARSGRLADGLTLGQTIVRLHTRQSVIALNSKNQQIGSSTQDIVEYYAFQCMISNGISDWKAYGKVTPKKLEDLILVK